jgi:hypothetical protein
MTCITVHRCGQPRNRRNTRFADSGRSALNSLVTGLRSLLEVSPCASIQTMSHVDQAAGTVHYRPGDASHKCRIDRTETSSELRRVAPDRRPPECGRVGIGDRHYLAHISQYGASSTDVRRTAARPPTAIRIDGGFTRTRYRHTSRCQPEYDCGAVASRIAVEWVAQHARPRR